MAVSKRIVVDSNFFIGLFNPVDTNHKRAVDLAKKLEAQQSRLVLSTFIFLETVTVLAQRRGKSVAREVGTLLRTDPFVTIMVVDEVLNDTTWRIFHNVEDKNISFVDCSIITLMQAENISTLLTFDTDFNKLHALHPFTFFE